MSRVEDLGIVRLEALHYYVRDLARSKRFYGECLDLPLVAESDEETTSRGKQRTIAYDTGHTHIVLSQPEGEGGRAARYLGQHPDGIGTLVFEVKDVERTFKLLDGRGGTPIQEIQRDSDSGGDIAYFSITTPLGGTTFRFVQRDGYAGAFPGMKTVGESGKNTFGLGPIDHVTSNFETMSPALLWMEHVLAFDRYWDIEFHTSDVNPEGTSGSGLRSVVMRDPVSGVKFANNEPLRPFFKTSQINLFHRDQRGDGVQHVALLVDDLVGAVKGMRERGVQVMDTPGSYYDALPKRLEECGVGAIEEDIDELRELGILVDGEEKGKYMLQVFLKDSQSLYGDPEAGPFFFELIQRKGDQGFGAGNFRALFESIERDQVSQGAA